MFDFCSRIAKLDAVSLDREFLSFLTREVGGLLSLITSEEFLQKCAPEIALVVKFVIWKFTASSTGSTIGQKLLGIKYGSASGKLKLLFVLEGLIPYIVERLNSIPQTGLTDKVRDYLRHGQRLFKILHVINFCTFLFENRYPTVSTRLLKIPMVPVHLRFGPSVSYSYQIRELLWHQFADFLIMTLPLINFRKLKSYVGSWIPGRGDANETRHSTTIRRSLDSDGNDSANPEASNDEAQGAVICVACDGDAVMPQSVGSSYYCYYCYYSMFDQNF